MPAGSLEKCPASARNASAYAAAACWIMTTAMNLTISLPDDLQAKLEAAAHADGKPVADVYREAAERYIAHRDLDDLGRRGRAYAQALDR